MYTSQSYIEGLVCLPACLDVLLLFRELVGQYCLPIYLDTAACR